MPETLNTLIVLLHEASRQSGPFQSLIHDYSLDVMGDPEVHRLFTTRLHNDLPILRRISTLKTSLLESSFAGPDGISTAMNEVLEAASALPATSHTSIAEIVNLVAVELAYRRMDQGLDEPLAAFERLSDQSPG